MLVKAYEEKGEVSPLPRRLWLGIYLDLAQWKVVKFVIAALVIAFRGFVITVSLFAQQRFDTSARIIATQLATCA